MSTERCHKKIIKLLIQSKYINQKKLQKNLILWRKEIFLLEKSLSHKKLENSENMMNMRSVKKNFQNKGLILMMMLRKRE